MKIWHLSLLSGLFSLLLAGCSSQPSATQSLEIKPGLILVTPDQAKSHGFEIETQTRKAAEKSPLPSCAAVLASPQVHAYSVGRYQDPADPNLLHEAHVVYRREKGSEWRLEAGPAEQILVGPRITDRNPDSEFVRNKELNAFLLDLRNASQENRQAIQLMSKAIEVLIRQQQLSAANSPQAPLSAPLSQREKVEAKSP